MPGPARRLGLYMGLVSDDPQPASEYVRGELTKTQVRTMGVYALISVALWIGWLADKRPSLIELAAFWTLILLWMVWVGVRRARTPRADESD